MNRLCAHTGFRLMIACIAFVLPMSVHALASASYTLYEEPVGATEATQTSTSYRMNENGISWHQTPLTSTSFQILAAPPTSSSSIADSSSSSSESTVPPPGGRRGNGPITQSPVPPAPPPAEPPKPLVTSPESEPHTAASQETADQADSPRGAYASNGSPLSGRKGGASLEGFEISKVIFHPSATFLILNAPRTPMNVRLLQMILLLLSFSILTVSIGRFMRALSVMKKPASVLSRMFLLCFFRRKQKKKRSEHRHSRHIAGRKKHSYALVILLLLGMNAWVAPHVSAETTAPLKHAYNGHLLDSSGNAVTTAHAVRFSYWKSADYMSGDVTATGSINTSAANYANWVEVFTVTPDSRGYFSVQLGSGAALPAVNSMATSTLTNLFLQVEVKASAAANTAYEILDRDSGDATIDRSPVLSVPSALNADMIDRRDVGTGSGSIPVLQSGGLLNTTHVPGGTSQDRFTIDNDNTGVDNVSLRFGQSLNQTLSFDIVNDRFDFNDDVRVQGNLTVTGLINGVDINSLNAAASHLRVSSGAGLTASVAVGSYRLNGSLTNYAGSGSVALNASATHYLYFTGTGLIVSIGGFPTNRSFIPLAQIITNGSQITSLLDRRALSSDNRENAVEEYYHAAYPNATVKADGTSNVGQLWITNHSGSLSNHYIWSSTRGSLQDYDIYLPVTIPTNFVRWKDHPLEVTYRSSNSESANNQLDIAVFDTADSAVTLSGSTVDLANTAWTTTSFEFTGTPTWALGGVATLRMRLHAKDNEQMQLGDIKVQFVELAAP